jgi:hypothetical protein
VLGGRLKSPPKTQEHRQGHGYSQIGKAVEFVLEIRWIQIPESRPKINKSSQAQEPRTSPDGVLLQSAIARNDFFRSGWELWSWFLGGVPGRSSGQAGKVLLQSFGKRGRCFLPSQQVGL